MAEGDESFNITFSSDNPFVVVLTPTVSVTIADNDGMFILQEISNDLYIIFVKVLEIYKYAVIILQKC